MRPDPSGAADTGRAAVAAPAGTPPTRTVRDIAQPAFAALAAAFVVGVVVQLFFAGLGVFGADGLSVDRAGSLDAHRTWGNVLGIAAVALFALAVLARAGRRQLVATAGLAVLTEVAQHGLAAAGVQHSWAGGLHAADGAVILLLAVYVAVPGRRPGPEAGVAARPVADEDLIVLHMIHSALRRDLALLAAAVARAELDSAGLRRRWDAFARQLHDHHGAEDELVWPVLRRRAGTAADAVLEEMAAEHAALDPALTEAERAIAAVESASVSTTDPRLAVPNLQQLVETHLSHEEADALPLVRRYLTSEDLERVGAIQRRRAGLRGSIAFLAWILEDASPADRAHVLAGLPAPLRTVVRRQARRRAVR